MVERPLQPESFLKRIYRDVDEAKHVAHDISATEAEPLSGRPGFRLPPLVTLHSRLPVNLPLRPAAEAGTPSPATGMPDIHAGHQCPGCAQGPRLGGCPNRATPLAGCRLAPLLGRTFTSDLTTTQAGTGICFCGDTCIEISYVHGRKRGSSTGRSDRGGEPQQVLFSSQ